MLTGARSCSQRAEFALAARLSGAGPEVSLTEDPPIPRSKWPKGITTSAQLGRNEPEGLSGIHHAWSSKSPSTLRPAPVW